MEESKPIAIIGLGNPGAKYKDTRHNVGFRIVESLSESLSVNKWQSKDNCLLQKISASDLRNLNKQSQHSSFADPVYLILPQTYMNCSGEAAAPLLRYLKLPLDCLVVVHDDLDLDPGVLVLKKGGGSAGNRGVEDLIAHLGTREFARIRVGIGHPRRLAQEGQEIREVSDWVLSKPGRDERELLEEAARESVRALTFLIENGGPRQAFSVAQQKYSRRQRKTQTPESPT